ncbi:MAG: beta-glucuronidase [Spirochaetes bacterium]|nr:beta-glucuronidase [Spirochaetota bacterium]
MSIPRPEHPKPQFERSDWINLNGPWTCTFDFGVSGRERGLAESTGFERNIIVPFCPESVLSGIGHTDFIPAMWYHRKIDIPSTWNGKRTLIHFGGVDYECEAFIDGKSAGIHYGGTVSFSFDITGLVKAGASHSLVVAVRDDIRSGNQPAGKQSERFASYGCKYTRTTGIWQTVWLEAAGMKGLSRVRTITDIDAGTVAFIPEYHAVRNGTMLKATILDGGQRVADAAVTCANGMPLTISIPKAKLWSPESPHLYDVIFEILDGKTIVDSVKSYFGMRKVHVEGNEIFLNNKPVYLRFVLDQGFYPDGIWTAPGDDALRRDIELSLAAGFNGARLHQKVFEERFHYWADRLGYLTWGESSSWGIDYCKPDSMRNFLTEWSEIIQRDMNHPSIIAWTPLNETRGNAGTPAHRRSHLEVYDLTRRIDPSRPVNEASGYAHVKTDLWTVHNYTQDGAKLAEQLAPKTDTGVWRNFPEQEVPYSGQPYLVDEFGGIKWIADETKRFSEKSWGYGEAPKTLDEFYARLDGQIDALLSFGHIVGYCYTQLTDVEQEQNGIYNYDRTEKFDMKKIRAAFIREPK